MYGKDVALHVPLSQYIYAPTPLHIFCCIANIVVSPIVTPTPVHLLVLHTLYALHPGTPTLHGLLCFSDKKLNIAEQVGVKYIEFGTFLLEDSNGVSL